MGLEFSKHKFDLSPETLKMPPCFPTPFGFETEVLLIESDPFFPRIRAPHATKLSFYAPFHGQFESLYPFL